MTEGPTCMIALHQGKSSLVLIQEFVLHCRNFIICLQIRINTRNPSSSDRIWQWLEPPLRLPLRGIGSPDLRVVVAAQDTDAEFCPFWDGNLWNFFAVQTLDRSSKGKNSTLLSTVIYICHKTWENRHYFDRKWKPTFVRLRLQENICKPFVSKRILGRWWRWLTNAKSLCRLRRDKEDRPTRRRWNHYHPFLPLGFQDEAYVGHPDVGQGPKMFVLMQTKSFPLQRMLKPFIGNSAMSATTEWDTTHDIWASSSSSDRRSSLWARILARTEANHPSASRKIQMWKLT